MDILEFFSTNQNIIKNKCSEFEGKNRTDLIECERKFFFGLSLTEHLGKVKPLLFYLIQYLLESLNERKLLENFYDIENIRKINDVNEDLEIGYLKQLITVIPSANFNLTSSAPNDYYSFVLYAIGFYQFTGDESSFFKSPFYSRTDFKSFLKRIFLQKLKKKQLIII